MFDFNIEKKDEEERSKLQNKDEKYFMELCDQVGKYFELQLQEFTENLGRASSLLKGAIIGQEEAVNEVKDKINQYLLSNNKNNEWYPEYYLSLVDAIFHENWGLAGLAEWFNPEFQNSSSAKIIGTRIYFLENGKKVLRTQRISHERRSQLVRALLMGTPEERFDKDFHEVYMQDGTRVTIFREIEGAHGIAKSGTETIIFRRYIVPNYTFEEQASRGTIKEDMIPLLESMVKLGYNVIFSGAVGTAKTTILTTWESNEDCSLEGTMVETDPEIPLHEILPDAPIIQLVVDDGKLQAIVKNLMRSDSDYLVMAECRNGIALDVAITIANRGTRRVKITFHCKDPEDICYDIAYEVMKAVGGDIENNQIKVAKSFDYIVHMVQLKDKSQKRLDAIYSIDYSKKDKKIMIEKICKYEYRTDTWTFKNRISKEKERDGRREDEEAFEKFKSVLSELASRYPIMDEDQDYE